MIFENFYALSLFISVKAFRPSLSVLNTSQESEKINKMVSEIMEINVVLKLLVNLLKGFLSL